MRKPVQKSGRPHVDLLCMDPLGESRADRAVEAGESDFETAIDRRRSHREPVVTLGMVRAILSEPPDAQAHGRALQVLVTNVSLHGVGFRSPEPLHPEMLYVIEIGVGPLHLTSRLRLVRTRSRQDGMYDIGAEFC